MSQPAASVARARSTSDPDKADPSRQAELLAKRDALLALAGAAT
jgi:hypothetical protein